MEDSPLTLSKIEAKKTARRFVDRKKRSVRLIRRAAETGRNGDRDSRLE
jgi:hypothetical protein